MNKLKIITAFLFIYVFALSACAQQTEQYDILLKGGNVIDPANNISAQFDVAVSDGVIARVAEDIPSGSAKKVVDASGYIVSPGFIDLHTHVFFTFLDAPRRYVIPDHHSFQSGITTMVDAGTSGADNFEEFNKVIDSSKTRILVFLNIAAPGKNNAVNDPLEFKVAPAVATAKKYPEIIVGFKSCSYWYPGKPYDEIHTPWASVDKVLEAARSADLPAIIEFAPRTAEGEYPARSFRELVLEKMEPGDILTCMFSRYIPVVLENGNVNPDLIKAQKRGVYFDGAHGAGSFIYRNAAPAIRQGFVPDAISTDLHGPGRTSTVVDLLNVMSKFLNMGMSLEDVIKSSTTRPAQIVSRPDLGTLTVGNTADIAITEMQTGNFSYVDTNGGRMTGDKKLGIVMTLFGGDIVFDPYGVSSPEWETIPKDSRYWESPTKQRW
ncbi:amidohydrolase family protein [Candidatus Latescibacterota bacterium]